MSFTAKCKDCGSVNIDISPPIDTAVSEPKKEPRICEDYDSDDADLELISSDNFRFKVHSYRIQYASSVFRSMMSMAHCSAQRDPIFLTDQYVECSRVLKRALDIIYTLEVGQTTYYDTNTLMYVVDFANKWDIDMIKKLIRKEVRCFIEKVDNPEPHMFDNLRLALKLKDYDLACDVFCLDQEWEDEVSDAVTGLMYSQPISLDDHNGTVLPSNYQSEEPVPDLADSTRSHGGDMHQLGGSYYPYFLQIPPTITYIILRALHLNANGDGSVERNFRIMMGQAYPPTPTPTSTPKKKRKAAD